MASLAVGQPEPRHRYGARHRLDDRYVVFPGKRIDIARHGGAAEQDHLGAVLFDGELHLAFDEAMQSSCVSIRSAGRASAGNCWPFLIPIAAKRAPSGPATVSLAAAGPDPQCNREPRHRHRAFRPCRQSQARKGRQGPRRWHVPSRTVLDSPVPLRPRRHSRPIAGTAGSYPQWPWGAHRNDIAN